MVRASIPLALASCFSLGACGASRSSPPQEPGTGTASHSSPAPAAPPPVAARASEPTAPRPPETSEPRAASPGPAACAEVHIGLDLRALPRGTSPSGIDMFVLGQASDLAGKAPSGAPPEIRTMPGAGLFDAVFRGAAPVDEVERCAQTVAAYLATAPLLPILMEPAAQVITACRPCSPP